MKKRWTVLVLAMLLTVGMTACTANRTGSSTGTQTTVTPQPETTPTPAPGSAAPETGNPGTDDLAGADGMVGDEGDDAFTGTDTGDDMGTTNSRMGTLPDVYANPMEGGTANGMGALGNGYPDSRQGRDMMEGLGNGVRNTLDDMGDMAREMGRSAKAMLQ